MVDTPTPEHHFWARELIRLAKQQAAEKGVPGDVLARAMLLEAWMLWTGQSEEDAKKSVQAIYAQTIAKKFANSAPPMASEGSSSET